MVLSDVTIRERIASGELEITPYDDTLVEPSSVDLRLGSDFKRVTCGVFSTVDTAFGPDDSLEYEHIDGDVTIDPDGFVLATTQEEVHLPDDLSANVLGRSSLGRLGISVHQTAGYIDPGFHGEVTLELSNHGPAPVKLHAGDRICQIVFHELSTPAETPYGHDGSQYQGQHGATPSGMRFE